MTYQVPGASGARTVTVNKEATGDGGFGYFVSHERYRNFVDGGSDTAKFSMSTTRRLG